MITFYDNKGKTIDRYGMDVQCHDGYDCYSFSEEPLSPQGINTFNGTIKDVGHEDDYQIRWDDVPENVQRAMLERLMPIPM
jgi:hypothetical protein